MNNEIKKLQIDKIDINPDLVKKNINKYLKKYKTRFSSSNDFFDNSLTKEKISFEIHNTNEQVCNTIRRVMLESIPVYSLTFDIEDYLTDDKFALYDKIQKQINGIPINQELAKQLFEDEDYSITLNVKNTTSDKIDVLSNDIIVKHKNKTLKTVELIPENIIIIGDSCFMLCPETRSFIGQYYLAYKYASLILFEENRPGNVSYEKMLIRNRVEYSVKQLLEELGYYKDADKMHIFTYKKFGLGLGSGNFVAVKIKIVKGYGKNDSNSFSAFNGYEYKIIKEESKQNEFVSKPINCKMSFTTYGNIKPKTLMNICFDIIINKFTNYHEKIKKIKSENELPLFMDNIDLELEFNICKLTLKDSTWTYCAIISRYCYIVDSNISYVTYNIKHPNDNYGYVKLKHPNYLKLLNEVLSKIIEDFINIKKNFQ